LCQGCVELDPCSAAQTRREPDPQRCYQERRGVDLDRLAGLMADLRVRAGLGDDDRLASQEQRMWRHLADLQTRCANTFEPSMSWDGARWHPYRYTYSFHDAAPERFDADRAELLDWVGRLDGRNRPHVETLLRMAPPRMIRGLLFGLDARAGDGLRIKVYFRFHPGQADPKRRLLANLAGRAPDWPADFEPERLFLVGFDLGPGGVAAIKSYFLHERIATSAFVGRFDPRSPYPELAAQKALGEWQEVILIARQAAAQRDRPPAPLDANVHCLKNDIVLDDLRQALARTAAPPDLGLVDELFCSHPLFLSSITFSLTGGPKANLYYRLAG
jgi:hypothetical protein